MNDREGLNDDFVDMLNALAGEGVEFIVVGAHAMAFHGVPRATGDIDILVRPSPDNAARVMRALAVFGAPFDVHGIRAEDFISPGTVYQIGLPPRRIDLLTQISGVDFEEAWRTREVMDVSGVQVPFLGRSSLIENKLAAARAKDLVDVRILQSLAEDE